MMTTSITIREYTEADAPWALALNNANTPAVNAHDADSWAKLTASAHAVRVAEMPGGPAGLMVLFAPRARYGSINYLWFNGRYPNFLYVDRVIIDDTVRRQGVGRTLYENALEMCKDRQASVLTCEVNEFPPNPDSMRFHETLGFKIVWRQGTEEKAVALMAKAMAES